MHTVYYPLRQSYIKSLFETTVGESGLFVLFSSSFSYNNGRRSRWCRRVGGRRVARVRASLRHSTSVAAGKLRILAITTSLCYDVSFIFYNKWKIKKIKDAYTILDENNSRHTFLPLTLRYRRSAEWQRTASLNLPCSWVFGWSLSW